MLTAKSFREALDAFASSEPTPGGGSASAVASALGASLLLMVTDLPKTRSNSDADRSALAAANRALTGIRLQLIEAIDVDAGAYEQVVAAYRLPSATNVQRDARKGAVQRALRAATDVPLGVMRLSEDGLRHSQSVAAHAHRPARSDVGVAIALLQAGFEGARLNVGANLEGLSDRAYVEAVRAESDRLAGQAPALVRDATASLK